MSEKEENIPEKKSLEFNQSGKKKKKTYTIKTCAFFQESFQSIFAILFGAFVLFLIKLWFWS